MVCNTIDVLENKQFEKLRSDGTIGSSLDAEVNIYCNEEFFNELNFIKDELRFVLICSSTNIYSLDKRNNDAIQSDISDLFIYATPYVYEKCVRCWQYSTDLGSSAKFPEICPKCTEALS